VNATLGFGRSHVAPLISRFVRKYPQVQVQLQLSVNPPPLTDDSFDVCIRFGAPPDARVIAKYICAEPPAAVRGSGLPCQARHAQGA
jgi:LysR family transcriptional activator of dmlA